MHRSIHDASWSKFISMLWYKAQSAGRKLTKIDPRNILFAGMEQPVAPIEPKPLHHISVMPGFGNEVGSRALQDALVHDHRYSKKPVKLIHSHCHSHISKVDDFGITKDKYLAVLSIIGFFMTTFEKPRVVISKCIEFDHCRYNGSMIPSDFVETLKPYVDFIPVCAEMEVGLGVPRDTVRIVSVDGVIRLIQPATNLDVTDKMKDFSSSFLASLQEVDGFILKFRSPSCGMKDIRVYSTAAKSGSISKAAGFFGGAVVRSFPDLAIEDEGRLRNFNIREHFLTKLYALASFRKVRSEGEVSGLVQFQEANKFLLMAHSQKETRILGNIVANHEGLDYAKQSALYREHLAKALHRPPKAASKANVFMHSLGYFKDKLSLQEKEHFLQSIERYKNKKIPSSVLLAMLQSWIARFGEEYVKNQTFFEPFPEELVELCRDSQCEWAGEELFLGRGE